MLFDTFEQNGLLLNSNFKEAAGKPGYSAYRGDLVVIEGEIGDNQGRRMPPVSTMRQVAAIANGDLLTLLIGSLDHLSDLPTLLEKYSAHINAETRVLMFVIDAAKDFRSQIAGIPVEVVSQPEGAVWTELCEMLGLEKSDFKGQSAAEKVITIFEELQGYQIKAPELDWEEAQSLITNAKRQIHGAI